jgi:hypothetical protein
VISTGAGPLGAAGPATNRARTLSPNASATSSAPSTAAAAIVRLRDSQPGLVRATIGGALEIVMG